MERAPSSRAATGAIILLHGSGSWEREVLNIADGLDPTGRLHVIAPRAPLQIQGEPGFHWYESTDSGNPDPTSFAAAIEMLAAFQDDQLERIAVSPGHAVIGGFSMGAAMSYALAFSKGRPLPAGVLAMSGFIPSPEDASWRPDLAGRGSVPVFIGHGGSDMVVDRGFAELARSRMEKAGLVVESFDFGGGHEIPSAEIIAAAQWIDRVLN